MAQWYSLDRAALHASPFASWATHLRDPRLRASFAIGFLILFAFIGTFTYVNFVLVRPPTSAARSCSDSKCWLPPTSCAPSRSRRRWRACRCSRLSANGQVWAAYTDFAWIAHRHGIKDRDAQFATATGVIASITSSVTK
jgi:hypothetical protein